MARDRLCGEQSTQRYYSGKKREAPREQVACGLPSVVHQAMSQLTLASIWRRAGLSRASSSSRVLHWSLKSHMSARGNIARRSPNADAFALARSPRHVDPTAQQASPRTQRIRKASYMSVSLFRSAINPIVCCGLALIAQPGAIYTAGNPSVRGREAVIRPQARRQATAALISLNKVRSIADTGSMPSTDRVKKGPRRSAVGPITRDWQVMMASPHVPPTRFESFVFTSVQPPLGSIECPDRS